jgi:hypothetical protein
VLMLLKMAAGRQGRTEAGVCFFATVLKTSTAKGRVCDGRNREVLRTRKRGEQGTALRDWKQVSIYGESLLACTLVEGLRRVHPMHAFWPTTTCLDWKLTCTRVEDAYAA